MRWHRTQLNTFGPMRRASSLLGLLVVMAIILITVYVPTSGERDPVIGYAKGLGLSKFGIRRVLIYQQDDSCDAQKRQVVRLEPDEFDNLGQAICRHGRIIKQGSNCGTNGLQFAINLYGRPKYAQLTLVDRGFFVLHDGKGETYIMFESEPLRDFLDRVYFDVIAQSDASDVPPPSEHHLNRPGSKK